MECQHSQVLFENMKVLAYSFVYVRRFACLENYSYQFINNQMIILILGREKRNSIHRKYHTCYSYVGLKCKKIKKRKSGAWLWTRGNLLVEKSSSFSVLAQAINKDRTIRLASLRIVGERTRSGPQGENCHAFDSQTKKRRNLCASVSGLPFASAISSLPVVSIFDRIDRASVFEYVLKITC